MWHHVAARAHIHSIIWHNMALYTCIHACIAACLVFAGARKCPSQPRAWPWSTRMLAQREHPHTLSSTPQAELVISNGYSWHPTRPVQTIISRVQPNMEPIAGCRMLQNTSWPKMEQPSYPKDSWTIPDIRTHARTHARMQAHPTPTQSCRKAAPWNTPSKGQPSGMLSSK